MNLFFDPDRADEFVFIEPRRSEVPWVGIESHSLNLKPARLNSRRSKVGSRRFIILGNPAGGTYLKRQEAISSIKPGPLISSGYALLVTEMSGWKMVL